MGKRFLDEVAFIPQAIRWAMAQDVRFLSRSLARLSDKNLLVVGSGGSSTAAAYIASLHESIFGRMGRDGTPEEFLAHSQALNDSGLLLVSAEGKNRDILAAADAAASLEMSGVALTLSASSPLVSRCEERGVITTAVFSMPWGKDGYLATNSLLATMVLAGRAYGAFETNDPMLAAIDAAWISARRLMLERQGLREFALEKRSYAVLYGRTGRSGAIDIESKIAEAALGCCWTSDFRQFAHGRHLQLVEPDRSPCFLAYFGEHDRAICDATLSLIPDGVPTVRMELPDGPAVAEIVAVIDALLITAILSDVTGRDPGQPLVPEYGRRLHSLDVTTLLPTTATERSAIERKCLVGAFPQKQALQEGLAELAEQLARTRFAALVCDFDGTFCDTDHRFDGLDSRLIPELERLAANGIVIGFATGRGDSLYGDLRKKLDVTVWPNVIVGYYSGSWTAALDHSPFEEPPADGRFDLLEAWLATQGFMPQHGGSMCRKNGGQMSLRLGTNVSKQQVLAAVWNWISVNGMTGWRAYCSGHSIDVLTERVGKEHVVDDVIGHVECSPNQVLRIGDSGEVGGNDYELLSTGLSLSVHRVSGDAKTCWNILPPGRQGVVGAHYYLSSLECLAGRAWFRDEFIESVRLQSTGGTKAAA